MAHVQRREDQVVGEEAGDAEGEEPAAPPGDEDAHRRHREHHGVADRVGDGALPENRPGARKEAQAGGPDDPVLEQLAGGEAPREGIEVERLETVRIPLPEPAGAEREDDDEGPEERNGRPMAWPRAHDSLEPPDAGESHEDGHGRGLDGGAEAARQHGDERVQQAASGEVAAGEGEEGEAEEQGRRLDHERPRPEEVQRAHEPERQDEQPPPSGDAELGEEEIARPERGVEEGERHGPARGFELQAGGRDEARPPAPDTAGSREESARVGPAAGSRRRATAPRAA